MPAAALPARFVDRDPMLHPPPPPDSPADGPSCGRAAGRRRRIGLLGGSFNPAHDGHRHISLTALRRLGLDEVWWLVSPQNPLKPASGMAPLARRLAEAEAAARHPRIRVSDIEQRLNTRYTVDTVRALQRRYPGTTFVWLIGADNLLQMPAWKSWQSLFNAVAVAVLARPSYSLRALAGQAACRFRRSRLPESRARCLVACVPPAWVFLRIKLHPASATAIRASGKAGKARSKAPKGRKAENQETVKTKRNKSGLT